MDNNKLDMITMDKKGHQYERTTPDASSKKSNTIITIAAAVPGQSPNTKLQNKNKSRGVDKMNANDNDDDDDSEISSGKLESDSSDSGGNLSSNTESENDEDDEEDEGDGEADSHMDECFICDDGGELILCDGEGCNKAYHAECVNVDINTLPLTWHCPSCTSASSSKQTKSALKDNNTAKTAAIATKPASNVSKKREGDAVSVSPKKGAEEGIIMAKNNAASKIPAVAQASGNQAKTTEDNPTVTTNASSAAIVPPNNATERPKTNTNKITTETGRWQSMSAEKEVPAKNNETNAAGEANAAVCAPSKSVDASSRPAAAPNNPQQDVGLCQRHWTESPLRASPSRSPLERIAATEETVPTTSSVPAAVAKKGIPTPLPSSPAPTTTFRTVTIPNGVAPGDIFHVQLGNEKKVMGVICPKGVHPGDELLILEPIHLQPPVPPRTIAKRNARHLLHGMDTSTLGSHDVVATAFWKVVWPFLQLEGWVYTRQMHFNFGATRFFSTDGRLVEKAKQVLNVHYFETIKGITSFLLTIPRCAKVVEEFEAEIARRKETTPRKIEKKKKKKKRTTLEKGYSLDAWKYLGEREHIQVGSQYQVRTLPRVETNEAGEAEKYIQEQIWDLPSSTPCLTQSAWYDWAKDANFANQFHRMIMESKKQLHILASMIDKPFEFCLWYYYHKYKPSDNYQILKKMMHRRKEQENSDECAICEDGGDLFCCETCTDSYHLACLGVNSSDVEGVEKWSCPACLRKRKSQLSPPKSPRKRQKGDDSPDSKSSTQKEGVSNLNQDLSRTMDTLEMPTTMEGTADE